MVDHVGEKVDHVVDFYANKTTLVVVCCTVFKGGFPIKRLFELTDNIIVYAMSIHKTNKLRSTLVITPKYTT